MTILVLLAFLASEAPVTERAKPSLECLEEAREAAEDRFKACNEAADLIRCLNETTDRHLAAVDRCYHLSTTSPARARPHAPTRVS